MMDWRRLAALSLVSIMLVACGGGGSGSSASGDTLTGVSGGFDPSGDPDPQNPNAVAREDVAARAVLSWSPPVQREDGSLIAAEEIASYEIYHLTDSNGAMDVISVDSDIQDYTLDLTAGSHDFAVAAVDVNGVRSQMSALQTIEVY
jgi:hypothetical protein